MKKILTTMLCALFLFQMFSVAFLAQSAEASQVVRIAFVFDGKSPANNYFLEKFKTEYKI